MNDIHLMQKTNSVNDSSAQIEFDPMRWAQLNQWLLEGQADDRTPMNGSVKESGGTPSVQRAFARRSHQVMFNSWLSGKCQPISRALRKLHD
jgi:hypothetical protein